MEFEFLMVLFVSGIAILAGIKLLQEGNHLLSHGKKANAVVFKNIYESHSSGNGVYYPVVRFQTEKKEWITQQLSMGYFPAIKEGKKLEVIYDPEEPTNVTIKGTFQLHFFPWLFIAMGIVGAVIGMLDYLEITDIIIF